MLCPHNALTTESRSHYGPDGETETANGTQTNTGKLATD